MLILSIPYLNSEFVIEQSSSQKFTWKEYRLDFQQNLADFPLEILDANSIVTIRDTSEGGIYKIPFEEKINYYKTAIIKANCLVDLEIQLQESNLIDTNHLILSYHDFDDIPDFKKLEKFILKMNSTDSKFLKIAVVVNTYSVLLRISKLLKTINKPVIFAGMGKLGKISRLLYKHLGASGTFVALKNNQTASGQLSEDDLSKFKLHQITHKTLIGGIIGGSQVFDSLGLEFYNNHFQQNDIDAVYLPFVIENLADFLNWFDSCHFKTKFYGFSVTMPFKCAISQDGLPYNLFLPRNNQFSNTDSDAFQTALNILGISRKDQVLILGSGGSAETALSALQDFENVQICARNNIQIKFERTYIPIEKAKKQDFDLLINCTPIGMEEEDFYQETGIKKFKKVIDLPYQEADTKLIEFCRSKAIPFVDGKQFWRWQAEKQLTEFLKEIIR